MIAFTVTSRGTTFTASPIARSESSTAGAKPSRSTLTLSGSAW